MMTNKDRRKTYRDGIEQAMKTCPYCKDTDVPPVVDTLDPCFLPKPAVRYRCPCGGMWGYGDKQDWVAKEMAKAELRGFIPKEADDAFQH